MLLNIAALLSDLLQLPLEVTALLNGLLQLLLEVAALLNGLLKLPLEVGTLLRDEVNGEDATLHKQEHLATLCPTSHHFAAGAHSG